MSDYETQRRILEFLVDSYCHSNDKDLDGDWYCDAYDFYKEIVWGKAVCNAIDECLGAMADVGLEMYRAGIDFDDKPIETRQTS